MIARSCAKLLRASGRSTARSSRISMERSSNGRQTARIGWHTRRVAEYSPPMTRREMGRTALAVFFILAGPLLFVFPHPFLAIVPSYLPSSAILVAVSGVAEIAGGVGLLVAR